MGIGSKSGDGTSNSSIPAASRRGPVAVRTPFGKAHFSSGRKRSPNAIANRQRGRIPRRRSCPSPRSAAHPVPHGGADRHSPGRRSSRPDSRRLRPQPARRRAGVAPRPWPSAHRWLSSPPRSFPSRRRRQQTTEMSRSFRSLALPCENSRNGEGQIDASHSSSVTECPLNRSFLIDSNSIHAFRILTLSLRAECWFWGTKDKTEHSCSACFVGHQKVTRLHEKGLFGSLSAAITGREAPLLAASKGAEKHREMRISKKSGQGGT